MMPRSFLRFAVVASLSTGSPACAVQATSGANWASRDATPTLTLAGTTEAYRSSGGVAGARVGMGIEHALVPRNGIIHGGYDWRALPGILGVELGPDLGLGGPITHAYSGIGAYLGGSATVRIRLCGVDDDETAFNVIAPTLELVVVGRGGAWAPPESAASTELVGEYGGELGLRVAFQSDAFAESQGKVQAPVLRRQEQP